MATKKKTDHHSWHGPALAVSAVSIAAAALGLLVIALYAFDFNVLAERSHLYQPVPAEHAIVDTDASQAVFLTNGQVYFGDLSWSDEHILVLENVFYIQVDDELQEGELSLVKLGEGELHAPEDRMIISRAQVLFWENLTDESAVVSAMEEYVENGGFAVEEEATESPEEEEGEESTEEVE